MIMSHYAKRIALLLIIVLTSTLHIEARESKFFSKATQDTDKSRDIVLNAPLLAPAPAPAPKTEPFVSGEGYGLYGHMSANESTEKLTQSYNQEETRYPYSYNKDVYNGNEYENGGYGNKEYKHINYNNNGYSGYKNDNYGYVNGKLGQSDTRFSENGRYYDSVKNLNNYDNGFGAGSGKSTKSGNRENEFDTMEEYEKQQGYSQNQGEYYSP